MRCQQAVITIVTGVLISIIAFSYVRYLENIDAREALENEAYNIQREVRQNLVAHLYATELFARELKQSKQELDDRWNDDANIISLYYQSITAMVWLSPDLVIQKYYPPDRQAQLLGTPFKGSELTTTLLKSEGNQHAMIGSAGNLGRIGSDIVMFSRIENASRQGFLGLIISLQDLLNNVIRQNISEGYQVAISRDGQTLYQFAGDVTLRDQWAVSRTLQLLGSQWQLHVWMTPARLAEERQGLPSPCYLPGYSSRRC